MESSKYFFALVGITGLIEASAANCFAGPQGIKPQKLEWTNRLDLTIQQQKLLYLNKELNDPSTLAEKRTGFRAEAQKLSEELGPAIVRQAKAGELVRTMDKNIAIISTRPKII